MIRNAFPSVVTELANSAEYEFFLTGSRFFGGANSWSDWDFFVQKSIAVETFLSDLGFTPVVKYDDKFSTVVYTLEKDGVRVDVQVVRSAVLKQKAQMFLLPYLSSFSKAYRKKVWDLAFDILNSQTDEA